MPQLHDPEIQRSRKIAGYILTIVPSLMLIFSASMKILLMPSMVENMEALGLSDITWVIGLIELICVILYWIPKTTNLGFFLICSYLGGIIVAELMTGNPITGISLALLFYIGTFLRKPNLLGLGI